MRTIAMVIIFGLLGLSMSRSAQASLDGWQELRWGMSVAQVQAIYGSRLRRGPNLSDSCLGNVGVFEMDYPMPRGATTATLCFDNGRLAEVGIRMLHTSTQTRTLIYSDLRATYGMPIRAIEDRYLWAEGHTLVEYMAIGDTIGAGDYYLSIDHFWRSIQKDLLF